MHTGFPNLLAAQKKWAEYSMYHSELCPRTKSSQSTGYGLDDIGIRLQLPVGARDFSIFSTASRPALRPTHPPIQ
jgi:hypothetical protein